MLKIILKTFYSFLVYEIPFLIHSKWKCIESFFTNVIYHKLQKIQQIKTQRSKSFFLGCIKLKIELKSSREKECPFRRHISEYIQSIWWKKWSDSMNTKINLVVSLLNIQLLPSARSSSQTISIRKKEERKFLFMRSSSISMV